MLTEKRDAVDRDQYRSNTDVQDIVERRFVKMTEAAIDIGTTLVVHERGEPPASNPETIRALADLGILQPDLAASMAEGARFRNVLAHTYGNAIDDDVVYDALADLERYRDFLEAIRDDLEARGTFDD